MTVNTFYYLLTWRWTPCTTYWHASEHLVLLTDMLVNTLYYLITWRWTPCTTYWRACEVPAKLVKRDVCTVKWWNNMIFYIASAWHDRIRWIHNGSRTTAYSTVFSSVLKNNKQSLHSAVITSLVSLFLYLLWLHCCFTVTLMLFYSMFHCISYCVSHSKILIKYQIHWIDCQIWWI